MHEFHLHWATIFAGTTSYFVLGAIWYGALARPWLAALGLTREEVRTDDSTWIYGVQLVSTFAMVVLASWVLHDLFHVTDVVEGMLGGLVIGVIAALASSGDFLYESRRRSIPLFLINSGYRAAGMVVLGVVVGLISG